MKRSKKGLYPRRVIGLTGNSGGGKTAAAEILAGRGGYIIDADELSHGAIKRGKPAYDEIVGAFGDGVLSGGEIDRRKLGEIVFNDEPRLKALEEIIHPRVTGETLARLTDPEIMTSYPFVVIDAPLLIEAGMNRHCDYVWVVTAPRHVREARIMERDGLSGEAADRRLSSGFRDEGWLESHADAVIKNDGDLKDLGEKITRLLEATLRSKQYV
ncbi:MAG: dephospho-CoA kinase [Clostridiales bacterium]|jgi:dephospho-CoA kinase|nr:dephospho-CoA kinase [Clostridiales bacterium]